MSDAFEGEPIQSFINFFFFVSDRESFDGRLHLFGNAVISLAIIPFNHVTPHRALFMNPTRKFPIKMGKCLNIITMYVCINLNFSNFNSHLWLIIDSMQPSIISIRVCVCNSKSKTKKLKKEKNTILLFICESKQISQVSILPLENSNIPQCKTNDRMRREMSKKKKAERKTARQQHTVDMN